MYCIFRPNLVKYFCIFFYKNREILGGIMSLERLEEGDDLFVTLELEDGKEIETQVITIFEVDGQDYIVLIPEDQVEEEEGEVYIYRYFESEDGEPGLDNIETQEEFDMVSEIFDQIVEDGEFDEEIEVESSEDVEDGGYLS